MAYESAQDSDREASEGSSHKGCISLTFFHLFWIFVVCSVVGLLIETFVSTIIDGRLEDRAGLLWGPFSPIYGLGGVLMTITLNRLWKKNPFIILVVAMLVGALFEFIAGWFLESFYGIVAWSYIDQPFNLMGHTSLAIAFVWGIAGLLWIKFVLRPMVKLIDLIPPRVRTPLTIIGFLLLLFDASMTLISFDCWFHRISGEPPTTDVQLFFAEHFSDEYMANKFQTMSMWVDLASRP